jgi:hypothetical protein
VSIFTFKWTWIQPLFLGIEYLGGMKPFYVDFKFNELGLEIASGKNKLKILEGVTGEIKHGRLTGISALLRDAFHYT